ncbi:hypothetical protein FRX31_002865 [Thalictrum thalictroides]|uniref:Uncharacterized protein n=1 Tax=Thalictrum thalictroides TaxID=46969 RepID=A0A7J6XCU3_THATH|nr:hypothetical protein FRX31_002865 [Thalictrum thalictroides]
MVQLASHSRRNLDQALVLTCTRSSFLRDGSMVTELCELAHITPSFFIRLCESLANQLYLRNGLRLSAQK